MKAVVKSKEINVVDNIVVAKNLWARGMGLMFKEEIGKNEGILIEPCNSIHTFFMKFNIDVLFINSTNKIIKIKRSMPPWRISFVYFSSKKVLELKGGTLSKKVMEGDILEFVNV